jgi:hypothetical protein
MENIAQRDGRMMMGKEKTTRQRMRHLLLPASLALFLGAFSGATAEPGPVPLTSAVMAKLVERTVQAKLIPYTVEGESGITLTLTALDSFIMDWQRGEFYAEVAFAARYMNEIIPIPIRQSGRAKITGSGLFSASEQKIGGKLLSIDDLKFDGVLRVASDPLRQLLNRKLAGKAFWTGEAPDQSEVLTQSNWTELLRIAVAHHLPFSGTTDKSTVNITNLESLESMTEPGMFRIKLDADGEHRGLLRMAFQGYAVATTTVWVDPQALQGKVRIDEVQSVNLNHLPALIDWMVRRSVCKKLQGTEFPFSWN